MPPKKSKKGKKGKKNKEKPEPEDEFMPMTGVDLEYTIERFRAKLKDSQTKRNMLQIEKDMIHDFYHNTREEIKELDAKIRNFDTQMERAERDHRTDIISHKQKEKHLEYEHQMSQGQVQEQASKSMNIEHKLHVDNENDKIKDKTTKKDDYNREDMFNIGEIETKEKELNDDLVELRSRMEIDKGALIENYERKLKDLAAELELRMKVEIHEIEERKNMHINDLMMNHESSFKDMKMYNNDITKENLELIRMHKDKLTDIKEQIANSEVMCEHLRKECDKMKIPLQTEQEKLEVLKRGLKTFDKDRMAKTNAEGRFRDLKDRVKDIQEKRRELDEKFLSVEKEKDEMYKKFELTIHQLRDKADYKNTVIDEKLNVLQVEFERKELTLRELVQRSGLDQATVDEICKKMEEAIEAKNSILRNLKYSLAHATKAYNDAIRVYEAKLVEFGIPADELGLEPLVTNTSTMPAGLVAA